MMSIPFDTPITMKHRTFLLSLLCLAGNVLADTTYTWNFTDNSPKLGGYYEDNWHNRKAPKFATEEYTPTDGKYKGQTFTALVSGKDWNERHTATLYEAVNNAIAGKGDITFSGSVAVGTSRQNCRGTIIAIGRRGYGLSIKTAGSKLLLTNGNEKDTIEIGTLPVNSVGKNQRFLTDFSVTIGKNGAVSYTLGEDSGTCATPFKPNWSTDENDMYTIGQQAVGWLRDTPQNCLGYVTALSVTIEDGNSMLYIILGALGGLLILGGIGAAIAKKRSVKA